MSRTSRSRRSPRRASRDFYRAAYRQANAGFSTRERRHLYRVASAKRGHIMRLDAALGGDAPLTEDFVTVLPKDAVATKAKALALGVQLETLLVRVYLNGVGYAADAATRLLLGRLLIYDSQALNWLKQRARMQSPAGLQSPLDLEPAAEALDGFLSTPDFPDEDPTMTKTHLCRALTLSLLLGLAVAGLARAP